MQAVNEMGVGRGEEVCRKGCPYIRQLANYQLAEVQIKFVIIVVDHCFQLSIPISAFVVTNQNLETTLRYALCLKSIEG